jgi:hypothetical protein
VQLDTLEGWEINARTDMASTPKLPRVFLDAHSQLLHRIDDVQHGDRSV